MNSSSIASTLPRFRIASVSALAVMLALLSACKKADTTSAAPAETAQAQAEPAAVASSAPVGLDTDEQRVSYGIGYGMGMDMSRQSGFTADAEALKAGISDGLVAADPRVKQADLQAAFQAIQAKMDALAAAASAVQQEYLDKNKEREGVTVTDSGLQYEVITSGSGEKPSATDTVVVAYKGMLIDGTEFDSSDNAEFPVNQVIPGWTEALQLMSVGDKWKLAIPAGIAYGPQARPRIPANSTLLFEVELKEIK